MGGEGGGPEGGGEEGGWHEKAAQSRLSGTDLWWIGHIPILRHARIDIHVSGGFAVEAGVHSWVVIPLIPKEAFPFHLASLDIDPGADAHSLSGHGMQVDSCLGKEWTQGDPQ